MRTVVGVVVGLALLVATGAFAADGPKKSCSETCESDFDGCMFRSSQKQAGECATRLIFCKKACPDYKPVDPSAPAEPLSCRDACENGFENCTRRRTTKNAGECPTELMMCRQKCPPEAAPPPEPDEGTTASGTSRPAEQAATSGTAGAGPSANGERPSTPAAVAPRAEAPASAPTSSGGSGAASAAKGAPPAPAQVAPGVVAAPEASTASESAAAPAGASPRVAPPQKERSFWCRWTPFCGKQTSSSGPRNCFDLCNDAYDACLLRPSKRPGECQTNAFTCRQKCEAARSAPATQ